MFTFLIKLTCRPSKVFKIIYYGPNNFLILQNPRMCNFKVCRVSVPKFSHLENIKDNYSKSCLKYESRIDSLKCFLKNGFSYFQMKYVQPKKYVNPPYCQRVNAIILRIFTCSLKTRTLYPTVFSIFQKTQLE